MISSTYTGTDASSGMCKFEPPAEMLGLMNDRADTWTGTVLEKFAST